MDQENLPPTWKLIDGEMTSHYVYEDHLQYTCKAEVAML